MLCRGSVLFGYTTVDAMCLLENIQKNIHCIFDIITFVKLSKDFSRFLMNARAEYKTLKN